jgi:hypothetical protein
MGRIVALLGMILVSLVSAGVAGGTDQVEVKVVKYDQMGEIVRGLKGKVVVVDFWADT